MIRDKLADLLHFLAGIVSGHSVQVEKDVTQILRQANKRYSDSEKEAKRRAKLGLLFENAPSRWQSCYYMRQAYRVLPADNPVQNHWRGGSPRHAGARCPLCGKPLLLFWDIDCQDPRFGQESPELFSGLERLPLYYCCRHPEPTAYRIVSTDRIQPIRPDPVTCEESPFQDYPDEFEKRPISLDPIPREIENLLMIANHFYFLWLNDEERERIREYLGEKEGRPFSIHLSQFGGVPGTLQGHSGVTCPNTTCDTHKMGHPLARNEREFAMKELAVIDMDAGFEMKTNCAQIVFHICWKCQTIHAGYQCD
ncbi:MAG: hypothetical protein JW818_05795 [Pirellulales bacterium]|nr:hypothetical protein [Pirellulales bacterium]